MSAAANPLASPRNRPNLKPNAQPAYTHPGIVSAARSQGRVASMIVWSAAGLGTLAVFGAAALWFHYGTAVFFEMIAAGISACF
jgi:hypothetical protein